MRCKTQVWRLFPTEQPMRGKSSGVVRLGGQGASSLSREGWSVLRGAMWSGGAGSLPGLYLAFDRVVPDSLHPSLVSGAGGAPRLSCGLEVPRWSRAAPPGGSIASCGLGHHLLGMVAAGGESRIPRNALRADGVELTQQGPADRGAGLPVGQPVVIASGQMLEAGGVDRVVAQGAPDGSPGRVRSSGRPRPETWVRPLKVPDSLSRGASPACLTQARPLS